MYIKIYQVLMNKTCRKTQKFKMQNKLNKTKALR